MPVQALALPLLAMTARVDVADVGGGDADGCGLDLAGGECGGGDGRELRVDQRQVEPVGSRVLHAGGDRGGCEAGGGDGALGEFEFCRHEFWKTGILGANRRDCKLLGIDGIGIR